MTRLAVLGIGILVGFAILRSFERLSRERRRFLRAFRELEAELRRRHDLARDLAAACAQSGAADAAAIARVRGARGAAVSGLLLAEADPTDAASLADLSRRERALADALAQLRQSAEAGAPEGAEVARPLAASEGRVAVARKLFNDAAGAYDASRASFPHALVARLFGFAAAGRLA